MFYTSALMSINEVCFAQARCRYPSEGHFFIFLISFFISVNIKVVMDTNFDLIASYYRDTYIQGFILILRSTIFLRKRATNREPIMAGAPHDLLFVIIFA